MSCSGEEGDSVDTELNQISDALTRLENVIENKISSLKHDLAIETKENLLKLEKRIKFAKKHDFKHAGNQQQFEHLN